MTKQMPQMSPLQTQTNSEEDIEVIAQADDLWKVRILFPTLEASDYEMVVRMREAKRMISLQTGTPVESLELHKLLEKTQTPRGVTALVLIGVTKIGRGKPEVVLKPIETQHGYIFQDMIVELNIHYLDEFDQTITLNRVKLDLSKHGVEMDLCDIPLIREAIDRAHDQKNSIIGLEVARGEIPSIGVDAELEYTFFTDPESAENIAEYRAGCKVKEKDIICQKIPPRDGTKTGYNVRGEKLSPIKGLDFTLVAGEGTKLSKDRCSLTALREGVAIMTRTTRWIYTLAGEKIVPDKIEVSVKPIVELNAEDILNIVLEDSVEILGNLREGSKVYSGGEIFLEGEVEQGSRVSAKGNVIIDGMVKGSEISTDKSIFGSNGARDAEIVAGEDVCLKGLVENSTVTGNRVEIDEVKGTNLVAGSKVTINRAGNDSSGRKTTIRIGRKDFYQKKLESHQEAVNAMQGSLRRIRDIFGSEIISKLGEANHQQLLIQHIKKFHRSGHNALDDETIKSFKELLQSVNPLQDVLAEKKNEIDALFEKASDEATCKPVIVIREKIQEPIDVTLNEKTQTIDSVEGGTAITGTEDGEFQTYKLLKPSKKPHAKRRSTKSDVKTKNHD